MANYVLLETINLTQNAASVTFDNLPTSGYTDLKIIASARNNAADNWINVRFNNSTSNYSLRWFYGYGSGTSTGSGAVNTYGLFANQSGDTANTYSNNELHICNYLSSNYKAFSLDGVQENNASVGYEWLGAGLWSDTNPITSIVLVGNGGSNILAGSTFSLYGLAAVGTTPAVAPKATGGNIVANDGTYWYHAFTTSGTFKPQTDLSCVALLVAGGGGGAPNIGGGGGAGGVLYNTSQSLTSGTNYNVTIGSGGWGGLGPSDYNPASPGNNTTFNSLTAIGGGGGGNASFAGQNGGSGGGTRGTYQSAGNGTSGQGWGGGSGNNNWGTGGGGAGGYGGSDGSSTTGAGGAGTNTYSAMLAATNLGVSGYIAGGGGGGGFGSSAYGSAGGSGGGGAGGYTNNDSGTDAIVSTGSGGGGGAYSGLRGGAGASGLVIIRYAMA